MCISIYLSLSLSLSLYMCIYIYIYTYIHVYTLAAADRRHVGAAARDEGGALEDLYYTIL